MNETSSVWQPEVLQNSKVKLLPLASADFEVLYAVAADPLIWEQHPARDRYKKEVFREFFDTALRTGTAFLVRDRMSSEAIGSTRFYDHNPSDSSIAIGFTFLARRYWGGEYNRSLKQLMLDHAFLFVEKVILHVGAVNVRSQKAVLKLGAVKTREFYKEPQNETSLTFEYTLARQNWQTSVKASS
jgi:RimJ/RimL family protein N-acetyltransferase